MSTENPDLLIEIPDILRKKLELIRAEQMKRRIHLDDVMSAKEAVIITTGMGPQIYLTLDGRVIIWDTGQLTDEPFDPREAETLDEVAAALTIGAKRLDLPELLDLLPSPPEDAAECQLCNGSRVYLLDRENHDADRWIVCLWCSGKGWVEKDKGSPWQSE